ncbi:MAG: prepilin-type N-terminal cleavage/methylation domain-containing protein [Proteobacteria bacterium]|nr:prepilin-type N-terminal cleavage/methylation domain-containing protein [Pseudomonadota bacterium]
MRKHKNHSKDHSKGFTLLELVVAVAIIGILATIALPSYMEYIEKARAVQCLSNRYHIEVEKYGEIEDHYAGNNPVKRSLEESGNINNPVFYNLFSRVLNAGIVDASSMDEIWKCPSGGIYLWVDDPDHPDHPRVVCSIHGGGVQGGHQKPDELFSSKFENMESLTRLRGRWEIRKGALVPRGRGENRLAFGDKNWKDYEIKTNVTLDKGKGYGIYYRADGKRNISGYIFQYDPGYGKSFLVRKVYKGREKSPFQRVKMPKGFSIYKQTHEVAITVENNHHIIKVDGEAVFDFEDDTFSSGMAGFRTWGNSKVNFDDVVVNSVQ